MSSYATQLDAWEGQDDVVVRKSVPERIAKKAYSPRFEHRRAHSPASTNGAHRRRDKRSYV
jgi:hypothetical protein